MKDLNEKRATDVLFARWASALIFTMSLLLMAEAPVLAGNEKLVKSSIPDVIDINTQARCPSIKGLPKDIKEVKGFKHALHAEKYLKGNSAFSGYAGYTDDFTCRACHVGASRAEDISGDNVCDMIDQELNGGKKRLRPMELYHKMCLKCHKNMKKAGKTTGPVSCKGCHSKKAR